MRAGLGKALVEALRRHELVRGGGAPLEDGARWFRLPVGRGRALEVRVTLKTTRLCRATRRRAPEDADLDEMLSSTMEEVERAMEQGWQAAWEDRTPGKEGA